MAKALLGLVLFALLWAAYDSGLILTVLQDLRDSLTTSSVF